MAITLISSNSIDAFERADSGLTLLMTGVRLIYRDDTATTNRRSLNILITGVHGFVGSNLVRALSKEHVIYGLDIIAPEKEGVVKTYSWEDMRLGRLPEVDAIIHLAGKAHDVKSNGQAQRDAYFEINTGLTTKAYDYFLSSTARKFIFFSSIKAAADSVEGEYVDENVTPRPRGPYGESKRAAEEYIMSRITNPDAQQSGIANPQQPQADSTENTEKQTYILRPCMIHGPGNKGNLNLLYGVVKKGIPWPLGAFENRRTFTSIDNVSFIVEGVLTKDVPSGIYNINDDEAVSSNELIEIICRVTGKKPHIWRVPQGMMRTLASMGDWLHLPLNSERLRKLTENYVSRNAKIKAALGVDRLPVRAVDGLTQTIESFAK